MKSQDLMKLHDSYKVIFSTPDGERVLDHLCKISFLADTSYVAGDPYETAHREGQRRRTRGSTIGQVGVDQKPLRNLEAP